MIVHTLFGERSTAVAQAPGFIFGTVSPLGKGGGRHTWPSALQPKSWHLPTLVFKIRLDILPHDEVKAVEAYRS